MFEMKIINFILNAYKKYKSNKKNNDIMDLKYCDYMTGKIKLNKNEYMELMEWYHKKYPLKIN